MGIAKHSPGRYDNVDDNDADNMDCFSPYVPGAYAETNGY